MSFYPKISYPIGGKLVQGGLPTANQILQFNAVTNQWEYIALPVGPDPTSNTFARVVKILDETVNNSIVLQDDDELTVVLNINQIYSFILLLLIGGTDIARMDIGLTVPAGATATWLPTDQGFSPNFRGSADATARLSPSGNMAVLSMLETTGRIIMGATPGPVTLQWAQRVAEVSNTQVFRGSSLIIWEQL